MKVWLDWLYDLFDLPRMEWTDDGWNGVDKVGHFILHACIGYRFGLVGDVFGGVVVGLAFGWVWEMYDSARDVGASWKDLLYNILGLFGGLVVGMLLRGT